MKVSCKWTDAMAFEASSGDHKILMDAKKPIGRDTGMTPKELVVAGLCGCTAMDVAAYLRKHKSVVESLEVSANVEMSAGGYPVVFNKVELFFRAQGQIDAQKLEEAVKLSQTQYCGVSAMLSKAVGISYSIELNNLPIASGEASFS